MLDLIHAIVIIVVVSVVLSLILLWLLVYALAMLQLWWQARHPKKREPEKPSLCPECGELAFYYLSVCLCDGWDEAGNEVGWSEALGECRSCNVRFFHVNSDPWRRATPEEWNQFVDMEGSLRQKTNPVDSYYSVAEELPFRKSNRY